MNSKELKDLEKANKASENLSKIKFQDKSIKLKMDVSQITVDHLEKVILKMNMGDNMNPSDQEYTKWLEETGGKKNLSRIKKIDESVDENE